MQLCVSIAASDLHGLAGKQPLAGRGRSHGWKILCVSSWKAQICRTPRIGLRSKRGLYEDMYLYVA